MQGEGVKRLVLKKRRVREAVTAGDIPTTGDNSKILNPQLVICTLDESEGGLLRKSNVTVIWRARAWRLTANRVGGRRPDGYCRSKKHVSPVKERVPNRVGGRTRVRARGFSRQGQADA